MTSYLHKRTDGQRNDLLLISIADVLEYTHLQNITSHYQ